MLSKCMHGWQSGAAANVLMRTRCAVRKRIAANIQRIGSAFGRFDARDDILGLHDFEPERSRPSRTAAAWTRSISDLMRGLSALPRTATRLRAGTTSRNSCKSEAPKIGLQFDRPVTLPPGRARLAPARSRPGLQRKQKLIGIVASLSCGCRGTCRDDDIDPALNNLGRDQPPHGALSRRSDTGQISWGKSSRLPCTVAGSTLRVLDGYGLRGMWPARPMLAPCTRSCPSTRTFALRFLQTSPRGDSPCVVANPSPPSGWVEDFHLQATEHAQHTTKSLRDSPLRG